jgi:hypothetical protein
MNKLARVCIGLLIASGSIAVLTLAIALLSQLPNRAHEVSNEGHGLTESPTIHYLRHKDYQSLMAFFDEHPQEIDRIHSDGTTILSKAVFRGDFHAVNLLLARRANPNAGDPPPIREALNGYTLYSRNREWAPESRSDYIRILIKLVEYGADYRSKRSISSESEVSMFEEMVMDLCRERFYDEDAMDIMKRSGLDISINKSDLTPLSEHIILSAAAVANRQDVRYLVKDCVDHMYGYVVVTH